jgi:poly(hydroxyalkanoate) depolymerase family esterase
MIRLNVDMAEATRLTREGRLAEATALLRGALPGAASSASPFKFRDDAGGTTPSSPTRVIDMVPPAPGTRGPWTSPPNAEPNSADVAHGSAQPRMPEALREFLDRIGRHGPGPGLGGIPTPVRAPVPAPPLPDGARFEERSFTNNAGSRAYKLYVPSGYRGQPLPLVVMLHGCTQSPDDFATGTRMNTLAEEHTVLVAYPAQSSSANASKCWNWFNTGDQQRDRGEPSLIAGITHEIMRDFPVEPGRVYVAGLSAGGAAAAILGAAYPELYAAIGVHSGLACGAASDMPSGFAAMRQGGQSLGSRHHGRPVPTIVFHGDRDTTVNPVNGDQVIAQSKAASGLRTTITRGEGPGGINYTRTVHADENGLPLLEQWVLHGAGHAWSGGSPAGSYADPRGPDASREMLRFFLEHSNASAAS